METPYPFCPSTKYYMFTWPFLHYTYARRWTVLLKKSWQNNESKRKYKKKQQTTHEQWKFSTIKISILFRERTHGQSQLNTTHSHKIAVGHVCLLPAIHFKHVIFLFIVTCVFIMKREKREKRENWKKKNREFAKPKQYSVFGQLVDFDVAFTYASFITKYIRFVFFAIQNAKCKLKCVRFFFSFFVCGNLFGTDYRSYVS